MSKKQLEANSNNNPAVMPMEHDKHILSRLQLFRNVDLDHPVFDDLLMQCSYRKLENGDSLLSIDKENHHLFILISGRCKIQLGHYDETPLAIVEPGECVGEMSIIDSRVPSAAVYVTDA